MPDLEPDTGDVQGDVSLDLDPNDFMKALADAEADSQDKASDPAVEELVRQQQSEETGSQEDDETGSQEDEDTGSQDDEGTGPTDKEVKGAEKTQNQIQKLLSKHGFEDLEELDKAMEEGMSLKELVGDRDAKSLVKKAETLDQYERVWADRKAREQEETETNEETIARLKREKEELSEAQARKEADKAAQDEHRQAIEAFDRTAGDIVDSDKGLSKEAKTMAKLLLGIENPAGDVDPDNKGDIKKVTKDLVGRIKTYTDAVKQKAIDDYAKGKSKLKPIPKSSGDVESKVVEPKKLPKNADVEETIGAVSEQMIEILLKGSNV